ncbi:hypothetical protein [Bradyrhizobium sp. CCGUVB23]|uniref:hypothetical protein n=1 Tax=Bradyrhizobium sp. CCGUVB23 TaxID=2949630 RepID=UPI0020B22CCF|nr:hypothetical protein [Bradyrhizobium sp. CCGUVB23]MCP3467029.1 hypothetical protein [Bradyrhizobium sp. CCGUVB23]
MPVLTAPVEEGAAILYVMLRRIDLAFLAVLCHAISLEIAKVVVDRFGADEPSSPHCAALWVEFDDPALHCYTPRPCAHPARVPAPSASILQRQRYCGAAAARVEPTASLPGLGHAIGIAAGSTYGLLDLTEETGRASAHRACPARARLYTTTIPNFAGKDAKVIFVPRHELTIEGRKTPHKSAIRSPRRSVEKSASA